MTLGLLPRGNLTKGNEMVYTDSQIESALRTYIFFNREIIESVFKPDFKTGEVDCTCRFMLDDHMYAICRVKYNKNRTRYDKSFQIKDIIRNCEHMAKERPMFDASGVLYNMTHYNYIVELLEYDSEFDIVNMIVFNRHEGGYRSYYVLKKNTFDIPEDIRDKIKESCDYQTGDFECPYVFNGYGHFMTYRDEVYDNKLYELYFGEKPNEQYENEFSGEKPNRNSNELFDLVLFHACAENLTHL